MKGTELSDLGDEVEEDNRVQAAGVIIIIAVISGGDNAECPGG